MLTSDLAAVRKKKAGYEPAGPRDRTFLFIPWVSGWCNCDLWSSKDSVFSTGDLPFPSSAKRFSSASSSWCATSAAPLTPKRSRHSSYLWRCVSITSVVSRVSPIFGGKPPFWEKIPHVKCLNTLNMYVFIDTCKKHLSKKTPKRSNWKDVYIQKKYSSQPINPYHPTPKQWGEETSEKGIQVPGEVSSSIESDRATRVRLTLIFSL